jgi:hypothetical protein
VSPSGWFFSLCHPSCAASVRLAQPGALLFSPMCRCPRLFGNSIDDTYLRMPNSFHEVLGFLENYSRPQQGCPPARRNLLQFLRRYPDIDGARRDVLHYQRVSPNNRSLPNFDGGHQKRVGSYACASTNRRTNNLHLLLSYVLVVCQYGMRS